MSLRGNRPICSVTIGKYVICARTGDRRAPRVHGRVCYRAHLSLRARTACWQTGESDRCRLNWNLESLEARSQAFFPVCPVANIRNVVRDRGWRAERQRSLDGRRTTAVVKSYEDIVRICGWTVVRGGESFEWIGVIERNTMKGTVKRVSVCSTFDYYAAFCIGRRSVAGAVSLSK